MLNKYKKFNKWFKWLILVFIIQLLLPWQGINAISELIYQDNEIVSMNILEESETNVKWRTTVKATYGSAKVNSLVLRSDNGNLDDLKWWNNQAYEEAITITTNKTSFDQQINTYLTYLNEKESYLSSLETYNQGLADYQLAIDNAQWEYDNLVSVTSQKEAEVNAAYGSANDLLAQIDSVDSQIANLEEGADPTELNALLASLNEQYNAVMTTIPTYETEWNNLLSQEIQASSNLVAVTAERDSYQANQPTDPYSDSKETLWKIAYKEGDRYLQMYLPQNQASYTFDWKLNFDAVHPDIKIESFVGVDQASYKSEYRVKEVVPAVTEADLEESKEVVEENEEGQEEVSEEESAGSSEDIEAIEGETSETESFKIKVDWEALGLIEEPAAIEVETNQSLSVEQIEELNAYIAEDRLSDFLYWMNIEKNEEAEILSENIFDYKQVINSDMFLTPIWVTEENYQIYIWNGAEFSDILEVSANNPLAESDISLINSIPLKDDELLYWTFIPINNFDNTIEIDTVIENMPESILYQDIEWDFNEEDILDPREPFSFDTNISSDGILLAVFKNDFYTINFEIYEGDTIQKMFVRNGTPIPEEFIPINSSEVSEMLTTISSEEEVQNEFLYWTDSNITDDIVPTEYLESVSPETTENEILSLLDPRTKFDFKTLIESDTTLTGVWDKDYHAVEFNSQGGDDVPAIYVKNDKTLDSEYLSEIIPQRNEDAFSYWSEDSEGDIVPWYIAIDETSEGAQIANYNQNLNYGFPVDELVEITEDMELYAVWSQGIGFPSFPISYSSISTIKNFITTSTANLEDYVIVNKTAKAVEGKVNTWDITLEIEGKKTQKQADIVLVIDRSGSMGNSKMNAAKEAAKSFIKQFENESEVRIGIVSYASDIKQDLELTRATLNATSNVFNRVINGLSATGGTHIQGGLYQAQNMLSTGTAPQKYIVLLSDGRPTFSYGFDTTNTSNFFRTGNNINYYNQQGYANSKQRYDLYENLNKSLPFAYNITVGQGYDTGDRGIMFLRNNNRDAYTVSHYINTTREAQLAKDKGYSIYTVGFEIGNDELAQNVMQDVASPGQNYAATSANITTIFNNISEEISRNIAAATNMVVTDEMGNGFEIPASAIETIQISQGTIRESETNPNKIVWDAGNLNLPADSAVKTATMTYRLELSNSMETVTNFNSLATFNANNFAKLNYDTNKELEFPIPIIDPLLISFKKELFDNKSLKITNDSQTYTITLSDSNNNTESFEIESWHEPIYSFNLRNQGSYKVEEISIDGEPQNVEEYEIEIYVDDLKTDLVEVDAIYENTTINNKEYQKLLQSDISVVIKNMQIDYDIAIRKVDANDQNHVLNNVTFELQDEDGNKIKDVTTNSNGIANFTDLLAGSYYLVETNPASGYHSLPDKIQIDLNARTYNSSELVINPPDWIQIQKDNNSGLITLIIDNYPIGEFPSTGGIGIWPYLLSGSLLVSIAISIEYYRRRSV